jgi:SAM-dependent methyltransferase
MLTNRELPADFIKKLELLTKSYLEHDDPIRQSGFGGGEVRWRQEREPILEAIDSSGDILDIGCANGYLLECLIKWGEKRHLKLTPHGIDISEQLIDLARKRLPDYSRNFYAANAWDWMPPLKYKYVYALYDCVPEDYLEEYIYRLLSRMVADNGRLIIGAYGSRSLKELPFNLNAFMISKKFNVIGKNWGGDPPIASFIWLDKQRKILP